MQYQAAIETLANYHRAAAECIGICDENDNCDSCKRYRQIDRDRETYFSGLRHILGDDAFDLWHAARRHPFGA